MSDIDVVDDLIAALQYVREFAKDGGDTPIHVAVQPTWPLNHTIDKVRVVKGTDEGMGRPEAVWIALSHGHPYDENPYAPQEAWEEEDEPFVR